MTGQPAACAVVRGGHGDIEVLSELIAEALHDDPVSRWLLPAPGIRRRILPSFFALLAERGLADGLMYTTPGRDGAALWLLAGGHPAAPAHPLGRHDEDRHQRQRDDRNLPRQHDHGHQDDDQAQALDTTPERVLVSARCAAMMSLLRRLIRSPVRIRRKNATGSRCA
jgi:hypothetical protein